MQILKQVTPILHKELSVSLEITVEEVAEKIDEIITKQIRFRAFLILKKCSFLVKIKQGIISLPIIPCHQ